MTDKQFDEMDYINQAVFLIDEVLKYLGETDIVMEDVHDQEENLEKLKILVKNNMLPF